MGICLGYLRSYGDSKIVNGYSKAFAKSMFGLSSMPASGLQITMTAERFDLDARKYVEGQSISGVQRKLFVNRVKDKLVPASGAGEYILKPSPSSLPYLAENEHAIMNLARACGLTTAECAVVPFEDGVLGYVTKRFDVTTGRQRQLIEDGASICQAHPTNKGDPDIWSYEFALKAMHRACGNQKSILMHGLHLVVFSYLVGNNDLHLKNFALYRSPQTLSTLMEGFTPFYDLLSVAPYPEYEGDALALSLTEQERRHDFSDSYNTYGYYTGVDFIELGTAIGLSQKAASSFVSGIVSKVDAHYIDVINASLAPDETKRAIQDKIKTRLRNIRANFI